MGLCLQVYIFLCTNPSGLWGRRKFLSPKVPRRLPKILLGHNQVMGLVYQLLVPEQASEKAGSA